MVEVRRQRELGSRCVVWLALCVCSITWAQPPLEVSGAWIRLPPPGARTAAGYAELTNAGEETVVLVTAESAQFGYAMFHESLIKDGMARMRMLKTVEIPAGETWTFEPGGAHLMLFDPIRNLEPGDQVEVRFETDDGDWVTSTFDVRRGRQGGD